MMGCKPMLATSLCGLLSCGKGLADSLFAMANMDLDSKLVVYMLGQMLRTVHAAMLASGTSERKHE